MVGEFFTSFYKVPQSDAWAGKYSCIGNGILWSFQTAWLRILDMESRTVLD